MKRIRTPEAYYWELCPHCRKKLGKGAVLKRKTLKICKCKNCGAAIDERFVVR